ncbi:hypothetical protein H4R27_005261 [Coemansia aciculifera]|nr:hypothetical protein H4R27_005261 [Coemansia aciculifera]
MPFISLFKRLVGGGDSSDAPPVEDKTSGEDTPEIQTPQPNEGTNDSGALKQPPLPPPPMSKVFSSAGPSATQSTTSMASLRSQVESERQSGLAANAAYRNFTGGGHADGGHWNDPPTVVFKAQQSPATVSSASSVKKRPVASDSVSPSSKASSFVLVDETLPSTETKEELIVDVPEDRNMQEQTASRLLRKALDRVSLDSASSMTKRMVEDTAKRLALLDERLPELDAAVVHTVCSIAMRIDCYQLGEALNAHRDLMQAGFDSELKWLVGVKRLIELQPKIVT